VHLPLCSWLRAGTCWVRAARAPSRGWLTLLAFALVFLSSARADARPELDVTRLNDGASMLPYIDVLEDDTRKLRYDDVRASDVGARFRETETIPNFGFSTSAEWVRFVAKNPSGAPADWFLELGYPHLDHVSLYVRRGDGRLETHTTGDYLPFSHRDVEHPNFVFAMHNDPHEQLECYLRVDTSGILRMPLTAWDPHDFYARELRRGLVLWGFYGALVMMALFNFAVWGQIRQIEFLTQGLFVLALWAITFTFGGQTFQFILPNSPMLANKALGVLFALAVFTATWTSARVLEGVDGYANYARRFRSAGWLALVLMVYAVLAPNPMGLLGVILATVAYATVGTVVLIRLSIRPPLQLRFILLSWYCLAISAPLSVLSHTSFLPSHPLLAWAAHIGCAMQALFTSLALATRVKLMRDDLEHLNGELVRRNGTLTAALETTREAKEAADRANEARDDFLATMSHELRTPLNAIINLPQGMLDTYMERRGARCAHCQATFELEDDELLANDTVCPACHRAGTLEPRAHAKFSGDASQMARYLRKIERAGQHLLRLVNAVLDLSKIEAGALEFSVADMDMAQLLRECADDMQELAAARSLTIVLDVPDEPAPRTGDSVRLGQVVLNLLANAIKFSVGPSIITVRYRREPGEDVVSVADCGIGIAKEDQERIFARFEQVHKGDLRRYGGTGLGLAISRSLVRMHGGEIHVESSLGQGAVFTFRLPVRVPTARRSAPPTEAATRRRAS
jgi:signal transduction histidine kinase